MATVESAGHQIPLASVYGELPALPWRSEQDFPREGGLRRINDKDCPGGPARSLGSSSSLFSPLASQGSCPSEPETDTRNPTKLQNYSILAHTNTGHKRSYILHNKKMPRDTFKNPLEGRMPGTCGIRKLKVEVCSLGEERGVFQVLCNAKF